MINSMLALNDNLYTTKKEEDWVFKPRVLIDYCKKFDGNMVDNSKLWENVINCVQDGISLLDCDYNIVAVNETMRCWYEKKLPIVGRKCYSTYHDRKTRCIDCPVEETLNGKSFSCKEQSYSVCGKEIGKQKVFSVPVTDKEGNLQGVIEYVRDISSLERIKYELNRVKDKMEMLENRNDILINMLHQKDTEKKQLEESMKYSIEKVIIPSLQIAKKYPDGTSSNNQIALIEAMINKMENTAGNEPNLKFRHFTSREYEIAEMIKVGKSTKEIAQELVISTKAVEFHRGNMRKKLGLVKNDEYNGNLRACLMYNL